MKIDFLSSEIQFLDHLAPVYLALPEEMRGNFITHFAFVRHARSLGIAATTSNVGGTTVLVASYGDMKKAQALGWSRIARMEHGMGQSYGGDPRSTIATHGSYPGGIGADGVSLFLAPNAHAAARWQVAYPAARVEIVGCPKLDTLPHHEPQDRPVVGVSVHWDWHILPELRSGFDIYREAIRALAHNYTILGHAHPKAAPYVSRWFAKNGLPYAEHFSEIAERADVFVADNTSTIYEFAATDRPVILLNRSDEPGQKGYRRDVNHGLRFWDVADVGVNVWAPRNLLPAIGVALEDAPEQQAARRAAVEKVYAYRGTSAARAADVLAGWLEHPVAEVPVVPVKSSARRRVVTPADRVALYRQSA